VVQVRDADTLRDVALAQPRGGRPPASFIREARLLARLEHPHIVPVHDLGLAPDGRPYFTMKLLAGETLDAILLRLRRNDAATLAKYPLPALLESFVRVCDAVAFAHSRGVIHCDIKPANVQVGDYGDVRLIDWGLAQELQGPPDPAGFVKGTPGFMAPEQAAGRGCAADVRTDVYALGALLYAILTWHAPVSGTDAADVLSRTVAGEIVPPRRRAPERQVPAALEAIACKALAADPAARYPTAEALLADVHAFTNGYATTAEEAGPLRLLWLVVKRHRALSAVSAASLLVLAVVAVIAVQRIRASRDETRAAYAGLQAEQSLRARLGRAAWPKIMADAQRQLKVLAYDDALDTLRTAIGVDPAQGEAWELAGWICLGQEQYVQAAAAFRREMTAMAGGHVPRPAVAATEPLSCATQAVAAAVGRGTMDDTPATLHHRARPPVARRAGADTARIDAGLAMAEQALRQGGGSRSLAPDEYRQLLEEARAADTRQGRNARLALGVYCQRHNPAIAGNPPHAAFLSWALCALNDAQVELELRPEGAGFAAKVAGASATDLLPLAGLPLVRLDLRDTAVRDLQPLKGMPLEALDISRAPVSNFEPLYGTPLRTLGAEGFRKLPADLLLRCPALEEVRVSPGTELSRKDARWPENVRKTVMGQ
jgi:hypothetical protein